MPDPIPSSLPACHPANVTNKAGDFLDDALVRQCANVLTGYSEAWKRTLDARAKPDPFLPEIANKKRLHDFSWRQAEQCGRTADATRQRALGEIARMREAMLAPLKLCASKPFAAEIRQHCKNLSDRDRTAFVADLIASAEDAQTVGPILAAPPFLSGLKPEQHRMLVDRWYQIRHPDDFRKAQVLNHAVGTIDRAAAAFHEQLTKLVDGKEVKAAEQKAKAAEKAMSIEGA